MNTEFEEIEGVPGNPDLKKVVDCRNELMNYIVQYAGEKYEPEDGDVTVEMLVNAFAEDFPEFLLVVAEENWIRGYHQALADVEEGERMLVSDNETEDNTETADEETDEEDE